MRSIRSCFINQQKLYETLLRHQIRKKIKYETPQKWFEEKYMLSVNKIKDEMGQSAKLRTVLFC